MTRLSEGHAHESAYEALKAHFTEEEQVKLTLLINVINGWNRIAVGFGLFVDPEFVRPMPGRPPPDGERKSEHAGRSGEFRPAASKAHARRLPHARLRGRRRGYRAGGLHPLDEGRPRRGARARGVPAPHGHPPLSRSAQIRAPPARDLYRSLASRSRRGRGRRGRRHLAADAGAGTSFSARAGGFPAARCVRAGIRRSRGDHRARPGRLPPARSPRAHSCPRGETSLSGGQADVASSLPRPSLPPPAAAT